MTERRLENIANFYLQRFSTTAAHLRRVLLRRVDKSLFTSASDGKSASRSEMSGWVDRLINRLVEIGAVNDRSYADGLAARLRRLGKSPGVIRARLLAKGVPQATIEIVIAETAETVDGKEAAFLAALAYARRRKLGPYRKAPADRDTARKDLGAMARAGFSLDIARRVLAQTLDDE